MKKHLLIILLLFIGTMSVYPQIRTVGSDSERNAEYKKAIGLDMTIPDFDTNKIDAKVMGSRLANLLNYLLENYNHESYELQIAQILGEQNESLQHLYYKIKKMQFANASKQGDVMTVFMHVWPDKNKADVNQADLTFRFVDGVSDDQTTNALFSYMSRYVESQEALNLQEGGALDDSNAIVTNSLWSNWFVQLGVDMSLMNPYGSNFANVFTKGMSFGVDATLGKWFTPEFGGRGRINVENALFQIDKADWWKSCSDGCIILNADFLIDLFNFFGGYKPDRKWTMILYPRTGAFIKADTGKGSPIIGMGIGNSFHLNDKWSIYADVAYNAVTSVIGSGTGVGNGSNGYFDINVGVQMNLGKQGFHRTYEKEKHDKGAVVLNSFWDNWFAQVGLGMSLINAYNENFSKVFPNGKTFGVNAGFGKWFTPDFGLRVGVNWQNGIIGNNHLGWLDTIGEPGSNHDNGGYIAAYVDGMFNLHNLFGEYDKDRFWNAIAFLRAGLDSNLEYSTKSPLVGVGTEHTFKLNKRMRLFADLAYQFTSSEFRTGSQFSLSESGDIIGGVNNSPHSGSNGWFDLNVGIQYEFGRNTWDKPSEKRTILRWEAGHNWPRFIFNTGASVIVAYGAKSVLKKAIKEERPDHSDNKSFPSGHASMAFAAARSIDKEFRKDCIWIPIAGYAAATAIGVERVVNKHHHWYDVVAGAGVGFGSAELTWWLSDLMFGKGRNIAVGSSGNTLDVTYSF